jgi:dihydrofolate synthase/folylpolyglutamate synthase
MVFALWVFVREEVSIAVVETGVGGLHDASNICQRSDKTCLITDIGYDHQLLLGNSLEDIAAHKTGIIHKGNTVFTYRTRASIVDVLQRRAALVGAEIIYVESEASQIDLPSYQARNWLLAKYAVDAILRKDLHPMLTATQVRHTQIAIPGRMQLVRVGSRQLLLDGAHNEQKMGAFVASYRKVYGDRRVPMLVAMKRGKDYSAMLRHLQPIAQQMWCTEITGAHLFPYRSLSAELLGEACRKEGIENNQVETDVSAALQRFIQLPDQMKIITGSLYLVGEVLDLLQKSKK